MKAFADLHIHVGRTSSNKAVKITASPNLTIPNILYYAAKQKGLNLIGIVDAGSSEVQKDIKEMILNKTLIAIDDGGYQYDNAVVLLGTEVEIGGPSGGSAHFLAYFPDITSLEQYTSLVANHFTNINLSSQRINLAPDSWLEIVTKCNGVVIVAHAFTPHKGVYGNCVSKLEQMFTRPETISALELGLSADSFLASMIEDTQKYPYLSHSDAHSLNKIAREYTVYKLDKINFSEWKKALINKKVHANYGLDPLLGKYHRSYCEQCKTIAKQRPPILNCPVCNKPMITGVLDRIASIATESKPNIASLPPYTYQVPIENIPKIGAKTYNKLIDSFHTEMAILHHKSEDELAYIVGKHIARNIMQAKIGELPISPGGGGIYGKVKESN